MNEIKYCKNCVIPETRPNTEIDDNGYCTACKYFWEREKVNWSIRKQELLKIFNKYKSNKYYDCIVPSSGGKDSTYQVLKVKELGMNPLVLTITTDMLTTIGRKNIENLKNKGVDYNEYTLNPIVRKKINKFTLETVGDLTWSEEVGVSCSVVRIAIKMGIPLIVWGENSENENGGPEKNSDFLGYVPLRFLLHFQTLLKLIFASLLNLLVFLPSQKYINLLCDFHVKYSCLYL